MAGNRPGFEDDGDLNDPRNDLLDIIPDRLSEDSSSVDEPRRGRSILMGVALVGIAVAGAAAWFLLTGDGESSSSGTVAAPTIPADSNPYKIRPANPGGMQVPNQDKTVYQRLNPDDQTGKAAPEVEKLLPEPAMPQEPKASDGSTVASGTVPSAPAPVASGAEASSDETTPPPAPTLGQGSVPSLGLTTPPAVAEEKAREDAATASKQTAAKTEASAPKEVAAAPKAEPAPAETAKATEPKKAAQSAAVPAPASTATGPYTIQLAALRDEGAARKLWQQTQSKYPSLLGGMTLVIQKADLGQKGVFYRVRGTGLPSEAQARHVCAELAKDKVGCLFVGK